MPRLGTARTGQADRGAPSGNAEPLPIEREVEVRRVRPSRVSRPWHRWEKAGRSLYWIGKPRPNGGVLRQIVGCFTPCARVFTLTPLFANVYYPGLQRAEGNDTRGGLSCRQRRCHTAVPDRHNMTFANTETPR